MSRFTRLPTWAQALLALGAVLLVVSLLPMLASGSGSDPEPTSSQSADGPPSPLPLDRERGSGDGKDHGDDSDDGRDVQGRDVPSDGETVPRGPLPVAGGNTLPALAVGIALLGGGLGLLRKVGLHGERGWPGRYVRRIG